MRQGGKVLRVRCLVTAFLLTGFVALPLRALAASEWKWDRSAKNPALSADRIPRHTGAGRFVIVDPAVLYDGGVFRMWYGYGSVEADWRARAYLGYAESSDGMQWKNFSRALGLGSGWDKTHVETPCVVKDDSLPDGHPRKFRMYYAGMDYKRRSSKTVRKDQDSLKITSDGDSMTGVDYAIGLAFSKDGRNFTRLPLAESPYGQEGLVLAPNAPADGNNLWDAASVVDPHVLKVGDKYHMWYTSRCLDSGKSSPYYSISYAVSDDGVRWEKHGPVIKPEAAWETGAEEPGVGRPYVIWRNNRFEMFYDATKRDDNPLKNSMAGIGYAVSDDGVHWKKEMDPVFVPLGGKGEAKGVIVGGAVLYKDTERFLYYTVADPDWQNFKIHLAKNREK